MVDLERHPSSRHQVNWKTWCKCGSGLPVWLLLSPHSESDVPHVILVCESLHLRGSRGSSDGFTHTPHDGAWRHQWPCVTGSCTFCYKNSLNSFILQLRDVHTLNICYPVWRNKQNFIVFVYNFGLNVFSGLSSLFHRLILARSSLWEDAVWPGSAGCSLHYCITGAETEEVTLHFLHVVVFKGAHMHMLVFNENVQ